MYKVVSESCVLAVGIGKGHDNITETEYNTILDAIHNRPTAHDGYGYRLREDLTWELYELPPAPDPEDEDISADELLTELEAIL